jgi:hypothetical protein
LGKGDLLIRDLGYYAAGRIKEIGEKLAFYVSRLKNDVNVYESKDAEWPVDLAKFIDAHSVKGIADMEVFIGEDRYPARLIACLMSEEAINKRHRNANEKAKSNGVKLSKRKLRLLKYAIFITNIPTDMLSSIAVMSIYRARWRVELIFKQWKSCLRLHLFKGYRKERFHCLLYGRLIMILLIGSISPLLMAYALTMGKELSPFKLTNYFIADHNFARAVAEGKIPQWIDQLFRDIPRRLCMDKQRRPSLRNNVKMGICYYVE